MKQREQPFSLEAEKGVLSSMLLDPRNAIGECVEQINEEFFHVPAHQTIYTALVELWRAGQAIDLLTFTQTLRDKNLLEQVGGAAFVTSLYTFVPSAANIGYYLEILRDKYILRSIIASSTESIRRAYEEQDDVEGLLADVERKALSIRPDDGKKKTKSMGDNLMLAVDRADAVIGGTVLAGLPTGIESLDKKLGGLHNGETIVITSETGGGKSAMCHGILEHVALVIKKPVMLFSYELPALTVTNRMIASRGSINTEHIRQGKMSSEEMKSFLDAVSQLREARIIIDDDTSTTLIQLQAKARRVRDLALIAVDYVQKMPTSARKDRSRQQEIAENSDGLQKLAMELNIPILVLAQRNPDGTMREARDLAMDAKTVLKIVREDEDEAIELEEDIASRKIIIAKNNNGAVGVVSTRFNKPFVRFEN